MAPDARVASTSDLPLTNGKGRKSTGRSILESIGFVKRKDRPGDPEDDIGSSGDERKLNNWRITPRGDVPPQNNEARPRVSRLDDERKRQRHYITKRRSLRELYNSVESERDSLDLSSSIRRTRTERSPDRQKRPTKPRHLDISDISDEEWGYRDEDVRAYRCERAAPVGDIHYPPIGVYTKARNMHIAEHSRPSSGDGYRPATLNQRRNNSSSSANYDAEFDYNRSHCRQTSQGSADYRPPPDDLSRQVSYRSGDYSSQSPRLPNAVPQQISYKSVTNTPPPPPPPPPLEPLTDYLRKPPSSNRPRERSDDSLRYPPPPAVPSKRHTQADSGTKDWTYASDLSSLSDYGFPSVRGPTQLTRRRSRSLSRERIVTKALTKLNENRGSDTTPSFSQQPPELEPRPPRRRSSRQKEPQSLMPPRRKTDGQNYVLSGPSKSSINNPKLLETVEDAIRRLILPELNAVKRDQRVPQERTQNLPKVFRSEDEQQSRLQMPPKKTIGIRHQGQSLENDTLGIEKNRSQRDDLGTRISTAAEDNTIVQGIDKRPHVNEDKFYGGMLTAAALNHHDPSNGAGERRRKRTKERTRTRNRQLNSSSEDTRQRREERESNATEDMTPSRISPGYLRAKTPEDNVNAQSHQGMPRPPGNFQKGTTSEDYPRQPPSPLHPTPFYLHEKSETQLNVEFNALNEEEETKAKERASSSHLSAKEMQPNQSNPPALAPPLLSPTPRYGYPWGKAKDQFANDRPTATLESFKSTTSVSEELNSPSHGHPGVDSEMRTTELHQIYVAKADVPYKHLDYLGRGTFGWVDKVLHTKSPSDRMCYARKVIEASNWNASQELEVIQNEVSIIKRLQHEHMAKLVSTYQFEKQFCIIMLPVAECHLGDFLFNLEKTENEVDREKSLQNIWRWYGCLAGAVNYLHEKKVRHKDIKPANILVKEGNIYITDFGIAKDLVDGDTTASTGTQGARSPMYCAPEVYFDGHRRGRKADIFSLGCVFLEMTTVLSGASLQNFHSFRRQGDKSAYAVNLNKVLQWMAYLDVRSTTDPQSTKASYARYWAFIMLDPAADFRPSSQELVQGIQNKHYDFGGTGCGSCNPLVPNTRLRSTSPAELMDLANAETGEDVLNGPFEVTWEQARTKCLSREKWVGESLAEPSPPPPPPPPPPPAVEFAREPDPSWGSEAVPLPLRVNAPGHGLDRTQHKDIVALMNHLTVRDAQRNARDTEILVQLVRSAAEMRNSYTDMKRYLAEQDAQITDLLENQQGGINTVLDRPRPRPIQSTSSSNASGSLNNDDDRKKNVFKRALRGLSMKSSSDLAKIEDMLAQLLGEVEDMKERERSIGRSGNAQTENADVSSAPGVSSHLCLEESGRNKIPDSPRWSLSPTISYSIPDKAPPTSPLVQEDAPPPPPPQMPYSISDNAGSNTSRDENAPGPKGEKSQKYRSSSSSFSPKNISRWSETTGSTVGTVKSFPTPVRKASYPVPDGSLASFSEKTSYQVPKDGGGVTFSTRRKNNPAGEDNGKAWSTKSNQNLLIEYFEDGKLDAPARPSVRVKVTPSSHTKSGEDIKITEYTGERAPSYTRRINLTKPTAATSNDIVRAWLGTVPAHVMHDHT